METTPVLTPLGAEEEEEAQPVRPGVKWRFSPGRFIAWLLLVGLAILWIIPLLWMLSTSLNAPSDLFGDNWIPQPIVWENYVDAFSFGMWGRWAINTVIITVVRMFGVVLSSSLVAYSFARLRWAGREHVFKLVLATMMLPGVVTLIPQFILFARLPAFGIQGPGYGSTRSSP